MNKKRSLGTFNPKISKMNIDNKKISDFVKDMRTKKDFSQQEIAAKIGMTQANYSLKEAGKFPFSINEINLIAAQFEMTGLELLIQSHRDFRLNTNKIVIKTIDEIKAKMTELLDNSKPKF